MSKYSSNYTVVLKYCGLHSFLSTSAPNTTPLASGQALLCFGSIVLKGTNDFSRHLVWMSDHEKKYLPSHLSPPVSLMAIACRVCHVKTTVVAIPPSLQPCVPVWSLPFPTVLSEGQQTATNMHPTWSVCKSKCSEKAVALFFCPVAELWPSKLASCLPSTNHISWVRVPFLAGCHYDIALPGHLMLCFKHCCLFGVLLLW